MTVVPYAPRSASRAIRTSPSSSTNSNSSISSPPVSSSGPSSRAEDRSAFAWIPSPVTSEGRSLQIVLDRVRITHGGVIGVLAKLPQRSTASQQIPALIQGLLDVDKSLGVFGRLIIPQALLFFNKPFDFRIDRFVNHFIPLSWVVYGPHAPPASATTSCSLAPA